MAKSAVFWLNALPVHSGMSCTISPQVLMPGTSINFTKQCRTEFGTYAETYEKTIPYISTQFWTKPAICLGPAGKFQGSYWFPNLRTGRLIKHRSFIPLPIPSQVIERIHEIAESNNQNPALNFSDRLGSPLDDDDTPDDEDDGNTNCIAVLENDNDNRYGKSNENEQEENRNDDNELPHDNVAGRDSATEIHDNPKNYDVDPPGVEIPGVETPEVEIPGVRNPEKETDTNFVPGNLPVPTPTNDNNKPKVETPKPVPTQHDPNNIVAIVDGENTYEEDKNDEEMIEYEGGY